MPTLASPSVQRTIFAPVCPAAIPRDTATAGPRAVGPDSSRLKSLSLSGVRLVSSDVIPPAASCPALISSSRSSSRLPEMMVGVPVPSPYTVTELEKVTRPTTRSGDSSAIAESWALIAACTACIRDMYVTSRRCPGRNWLWSSSAVRISASCDLLSPRRLTRPGTSTLTHMDPLTSSTKTTMLLLLLLLFVLPARAIVGRAGSRMKSTVFVPCTGSSPSSMSTRFWLVQNSQIHSYESSPALLAAAASSPLLATLGEYSETLLRHAAHVRQIFGSPVCTVTSPPSVPRDTEITLVSTLCR
mmetsp:Transcript_57313/g.78155  ORF Transcript_57313/g.78155 Transcript_57313/m.78155 type:complete len:301 (+) Transcript_57313:1226-2128(+)